MSSVKNLNINEKAFKKNRKFSLKKTALILFLVAAISITGLVGYSHVKKAIDENQIQTIMTHYGEGSQESLILNYIELADRIDVLDLEKYNADSELYDKHGSSTEIMSPDEINNLIENFKNIGSSISTKDVNKLSDSIDTILNLKKQEQLVNKYIYTKGYSIAYKNVSTATKKYAGEVFGVDDYKNITFRYTPASSSAESSVLITNTDESKPFSEREQTYHLSDFFRTKVENNINDGVVSMVNTDTSDDENIEDNDEYNRTRNKRIKDALEQSAILEQQVEDNDLYNAKLAGKLK